MKLVLFITSFFLLLSCTQKDDFVQLSIQEVEQPKQLSLFVFMSPECPLCENYTKDFTALETTFSKNELRMYGVFSGEKLYTKDQIFNFKSKYHLNMDFVFDRDYKIAKHFNAQVTPECFLVNTKGELVYSGKFDNWLEKLGRKRQKVTKHYVLDAISSEIHNTPLITKKTEAVGCLLQYH